MLDYPLGQKSTIIGFTHYMDAEDGVDTDFGPSCSAVMAIPASDGAFGLRFS